jgi:hypothetical protein
MPFVTEVKIIAVRKYTAILIKIQEKHCHVPTDASNYHCRRK